MTSHPWTQEDRRVQDRFRSIRLLTDETREFTLLLKQVGVSWASLPFDFRTTLTAAEKTGDRYRAVMMSSQDYLDQLRERNEDLWRAAARATGTYERAGLA
jgi:hypothetical protein